MGRNLRQLCRGQGRKHGVRRRCLTQLKITHRARVALNRAAGGAIPPVATTSEYSLPFVAAALAGPDHPTRILDFGGGMGTSYIPLRAMLPKNYGIEFVIVENDAVAEKGRTIFAEDRAIRFTSNLPTPPERFDIVHFKDSLHYVDDWKGVLAAAVALKPEYLLFADLTAADNPAPSLPSSVHDRRIPVRFWNVREFVAAVEGLGFVFY